MASTRRRSGKRSATSASSQPPEPRATLFIDRCAWSGRLGDALKAAGIPFVAHRDEFAPDAPDDEWLAAAADRGWLVVTRDQRIRYKANEQAAMVRARLHLFVLTQGGLSAAETASIVVGAYPAIVRRAREVPAPAFFSVARSGAVTPLKFSRP